MMIAVVGANGTIGSALAAALAARHLAAEEPFAARMGLDRAFLA